ncbi:hypothetical protein LHU53_12365 [Rhodoferax sp. U2-2l]|uniref:hypothetical protein n=1 Tax=Rhodoferax sp. U2-2l TaxID=2884000 RepID=UPI001D09E9D7|nr:hypothetical protein [Rhodoferax sp. U2-2l]MCB8747698.1 hypothetical protein [Rhodoferax sp. U2-2l]
MTTNVNGVCVMKAKKFEQTLGRYFAVLGDAPRTKLRGKKAAKGKRSMVFKNRAGFDVIVTQPGAVFYRVALGRKGTKALRGV